MRQRWTGRAGLLVVLGLVGCSLLTPDEVPRVVELSIRVDGTGAGKVECDPYDLLNSNELTARGTLFRAPVGGTPVMEIARFPLSVGPLETDNSRLLSGNVTVPTSRKHDFWLHVSLLYAGPDGREPRGDWTGTVVFDIGQQVTVNQLTIEDLPTPSATQFQGDVMVTAAGESGQATIPSIDFTGPAGNLITASYQVDDVEWDDGPPKSIVASMELAFQPVEIFAFPPNRDLEGGLRMIQIDDLVSGLDVETPELTLVSVGQVNPGELLRGNLDLRFLDGTPPREGGSVLLLRVVPQPCN